MKSDEQPILARIEKVLAELSRSIAMSGGEPAVSVAPRRDDKEPAAAETPSDAPDAAVRLGTAIAWIQSRKIRDKMLGEDLFFDPAWSILLELYVHHRQHSAVAITTLCAGSGVPPSTGLRWMTLLEQRGLVTRAPDPFDRRKIYVTPSDLAIERIERTLDAVAKVGCGLEVEHVRPVN